MRRPEAPGDNDPRPSAPQKSGHPTPAFLAIAEIVGTFGVKGEVKANILTEFPSRFRKLKTIWIDGESVQLERSRLHGSQILLKLAAVDNIEAAERFRGKLIEVPLEEAVKLPRGRYYSFQIIGLTVVTSDGENLGVVEDILLTGANDVYVVRTHGREILLPAIKKVIKRVDLDAGVLTVHLLPGLR